MRESEPIGPDQPIGSERETVGDLPGATISAADLKLDTVYGDHVHQNTGQHLDGGIPDDSKFQDAKFQAYFATLACYPSQQYPLPGGKLGKRFVDNLGGGGEGVGNRKGKSEMPRGYLITCPITPSGRSTRSPVYLSVVARF